MSWQPIVKGSLEERLLPYSFRTVRVLSDGSWCRVGKLERGTGVNHNWPRS